MRFRQCRRDFLINASLAAAAGLLGPRASLAEELPPPETATVRVALWRGYACLTPQSIAEPLLRAEGFTDVRFVPPSETDGVVQGTIDFDLESAPWVVASLDAGAPVTVLAGVHPGCFELFAHPPVRTIADLRDKRVAIDYVGSGPHMYLTIMLAQVGLDPATDVHWVANPIEAHATAGKSAMQRFVDHDVDAFLAFAPEPQELRDRDIGKVILNTAQDRPWSHYFCCMSYGRSQFVRDYPIATKRFLRAILKAADLCAAQPELAARKLTDAGYSDHYEYALQTLIDLPYGKWREYDPADTLRFFALRLHEVGMVRSGPNKIIAEGADWRFVNELKRELKA
jgi:NitT/TauT family transport system substrate-binding protein